MRKWNEMLWIYLFLLDLFNKTPRNIVVWSVKITEIELCFLKTVLKCENNSNWFVAVWKQYRLQPNPHWWNINYPHGCTYRHTMKAIPTFVLVVRRSAVMPWKILKPRYDGFYILVKHIYHRYCPNFVCDYMNHVGSCCAKETCD